MQMILEQNRYLDELKMEVKGVQDSSTASDNKQSSSKEMEAREESEPDLEQMAQDHANMSKIVMSRNKRNLLEAMEVILLVMLFLLCYNQNKNNSACL
jgi:pescadillo protein